MTEKVSAASETTLTKIKLSLSLSRSLFHLSTPPSPVPRETGARQPAGRYPSPSPPFSPAAYLPPPPSLPSPETGIGDLSFGASRWR